MERPFFVRSVQRVMNMPGGIPRRRPQTQETDIMTTSTFTASTTVPVPTRVGFRERMHRIGMALFGPAPSGPYGPPVPPPAPRPRDHRGRLIREPKTRRTSHQLH